KTRLSYAQPRLTGFGTDVAGHYQRMARALRGVLEQRQRHLTALQQTLEALNPQRILERGYAIVRNEHGEVVKNALDLSVDEQLSVELGQGSARVKVTHTHALL